MVIRSNRKVMSVGDGFHLRTDLINQLSRPIRFAVAPRLWLNERAFGYSGFADNRQPLSTPDGNQGSLEGYVLVLINPFNGD